MSESNHDRPTEAAMRRMLGRLRGLKDDRARAERAGFGPDFLSSYDRDIWWQWQAIERAVRLEPSLAPLAEAAR